MATEHRRKNADRKSQCSLFAFLTICFTLCGAGACQPLDMNGSSNPKKWSDLVNAGNNAIKAGDYAAAETAFDSAQKACAKEFGKDDPRRATCLGYLAEMYRNEQEYRKAALIYKELIEIDEKTNPKSADLVTFRAQYAEIQQKIKEYNLDADPNAPKPKTPAKPAGKDVKKDPHAAKKH
jgi:tetratricopeptide (TPR) repeat protein